MNAMRELRTGSRHRMAMLLSALLAVTVAMASLAIAATVLVRLPADYLSNPRADRRPSRGRGAPSALSRVLKTLLGVVLIVVGIVLSLPLVPGPGFVAVLAGVLLIDFPGKKKWVSRILGHRTVLQSVNKLRRRFSRPPLQSG